MVKCQSTRKKARKQARRQHKQRKRRQSQAKHTRVERVARIGPNTPHDLCSERLTGFGGLLPFAKFMDLIGFKQAFQDHYVRPKRRPKLGCYRMVLGLLMLLFVGFQRLGHFAYLRQDAMMCGLLQVQRLPAVSTFWRYLRSLCFVQVPALLRLMAALRARVWNVVGYEPKRITVDIDTTVATVYGHIEGSRKGHNPKHRGKKGLRPVLCLISETREYLCGKQRRGETITCEEVAQQIRRFPTYLPACVEHVLVRGDGEFIGWESVSACEDLGYRYIFGNRRCAPRFPSGGWYRRGEHEYNECRYQPQGWGAPCRFVAMRIRKDQAQDGQLELFEEGQYVYRVFVTNLTLRPHNVVAQYDPRADAENSIGEAQREGILAIPSKKFQTHSAYFQIVMLAYNLWRWMKQVAGHHEQEHARTRRAEPASSAESPSIVDHTIRVARLKMLYVAAKVTSHAHRAEVYYSIHETRAAGLIQFLDYLDRRRRERRAPPVRAGATPGRRVS
jgi:hypothetical protein